MLSPLRAVVFDFDGLLMDTESTSIASWQREWARWDLTLDPASFFVPHGGDVTSDRYDQLAAAVGRSFDRGLSHERRTLDRDTMNAELGLAVGVTAWLRRADELGLRTAVASSSPRGWVTGHLGRVDALTRFEVVVGGDEVARHKPAPDVYREALARLRLAPGEAVAVEDTGHGVEAAQAAGLACVAIPNPFVHPDLLGHAELVLSSAADRSLDEVLHELAVRPGAGP